LDQVQLKEIVEQIARCTITAPVAGQVVYENNRGRSSNTVLIEEGMPVRERQTIINLPDPKKMRVMTKVHESRIGNVSQGQQAELRLDAMPETPMTGRVTEVSEYPLPAISAYMAHVKEYEVSIEIDGPPADLRPGMTAEVTVLVEEIDDALQMPIEAVIERSGRFFCAIPISDGTFETRELKIGSANETELVILSGLKADEQVVLNISDEQVLGLLTLPEEES
jgi:multidrug efflux pump subunit AcrA (membrane-fusion protein)